MPGLQWPEGAVEGELPALPAELPGCTAGRPWLQQELLLRAWGNKPPAVGRKMLLWWWGSWCYAGRSSQMGFAGCSDMHQEFSQTQNAYFHKELSEL